MDTIQKRHIRWRLVSDDGYHWTCWCVNGERVLMHDPKYPRKGKKSVNEDERILGILASSERRVRRHKAVPCLPECAAVGEDNGQGT